MKFTEYVGLSVFAGAILALYALCLSDEHKQDCSELKAKVRICDQYHSACPNERVKYERVCR